jgi:uncharacterized membrane protein (UPF0127 family)
VGPAGLRRLILGLLLLAACSGSVLPDPSLTGEEVVIGDQILQVWIADDSAERKQGLMNVEQLPEGIDGMLFTWSLPTSVVFHMKDTPMPLDLWWFDVDGVLTGSARMEPCPDDACPNYGSPGPVQWVLETPAGVFDLKVGDQLSTVETG